MRGCEYNELVIFTQFPKTFVSEGTNVYSSLSVIYVLRKKGKGKKNKVKIKEIIFWLTSTVNPLGNCIGRITSESMLEFSLQWISVSSKSKMIVFFATNPKKIDLNKAIRNSI